MKFVVVILAALVAVLGTVFTIGERQALSAVTVQALANLGYVVDVAQADAYRLPPAAKRVAPHHEAEPRCQVLRLPPGVQHCPPMQPLRPHAERLLSAPSPATGGHQRL